MKWHDPVHAEHAQVMVLAATNRPSELDEAILRRLPQAFEIGIPDSRERTAILKVILKDEKVEGGIDYDHIAGLCDGYTGSDILELCKKAAYFPIRDLLNNEKTGRASQVSISFFRNFIWFKFISLKQKYVHVPITIYGERNFRPCSPIL